MCSVYFVSNPYPEWEHRYRKLVAVGAALDLGTVFGHIHGDGRNIEDLS